MRQEQVLRPIKSIRLGGDSVVEVVSERYNKLVGRLEITGVVLHVGRGTPSRREIREAISREYGRPVENIYVRRLISEYGIGRSLVRVHVYDSVERAMAFEPKYIIKRDSGQGQ